MTSADGSPTPDTGPDMAAVLERLGAINAYFALAPTVPGTPGWRPVTDLVGAPDVLAARVDHVAAQLGTGDTVVAASLLHQGWAARLTAIHAGSAVLAGACPDLAAVNLGYRFPESGVVTLGARRLVALTPEGAWRRLVDDHLSPLADTLAAGTRIGRRLLWGNVASALAGALHTLARHGYGDLAHLVTRPWARPVELAGLGDWVSTADAAGVRFVRTTCCLYERLPDGGRCGDCSLWRPRHRADPDGPPPR